MRVAFTSTDGKAIDEHFGQATHFHLWEIAADKAEDVARSVHAHPSLGEAMMEAAEAVSGQAINI